MATRVALLTLVAGMQPEYMDYVLATARPNGPLVDFFFYQIELPWGAFTSARG